uniref:Movement protein TGB2 n=1 Tax=Helenium virus S TaxID=12171 RepID=A0A7U0RAW2_HELVS|nr:TGB2 [Helenium virus S]QQX32707.1 TGB2 [Helenium virus S]
MALSPPPDYTRVFLSLAIGLSLVLLVFVYSRSTLPTVGDNIHSLPHGGHYRDGTKAIFYGAPRKLNSIEGYCRKYHQPWAYVIGISLLVLILSLWDSRRVCSCGRRH